MEPDLREPGAAGRRAHGPAANGGDEPAPARRPSRAEAESAVRVLMGWAGDDPDRPGLSDTPARVAKAFGELFAGYGVDPVLVLRRSAMPDRNAGQLVLVRGIRFVSFCEHHLLPFTGQAAVGYVPRLHVAGLGAIAAAVDALARRLQVQERLTDELASALAEALDPLGVAVVLQAEHQCLAVRGARKIGAQLVTTRQLGSLAADTVSSRTFLALLGAPPATGGDAETGIP